MAQRHRLVPAPDTKPSARAELARLLTMYVWWQGGEEPAFDTRAQTSNYINRMPWDVLAAHGHDPEQMPRYIVTLPGDVEVDVLVLARGKRQAEAALRAALPEGATFSRREEPEPAARSSSCATSPSLPCRRRT